MANLILGIDAAPLRGGGSTTHLVELLRAARPHEYGFTRVIVWGGEITLNQIEERPWLRKIHEPLLDKPLLSRLFWQRMKFDGLAHKEGCNLLFIPGGSYFGSSRPFVTMCQNMLPFEWAEARRYGISWLTLKFLFLRKINPATFRKADGLILLNEYARAAISPFLNGQTGRITLIPHGVDERFFKEPKPQRSISMYSIERPFHLLYISQVEPYKHHWHVMEAVHRLRKLGLPLVLELIGPINSQKGRFNKAISKWDPKGEWIRNRGEIPFHTIHENYHEADLFVFASSCENMPIALLEAMASGLPIASSKRGPMPAMLGDSSVYFDPEHPGEISKAIKTLIEDPGLRTVKSWASYEIAKTYTWRRCADDTFELLAQVGQRDNSKITGKNNHKT